MEEAFATGEQRVDAKFVIITSLNTVTLKSEVVSIKEIKYNKTEAQQSQEAARRPAVWLTNGIASGKIVTLQKSISRRIRQIKITVVKVTRSQINSQKLYFLNELIVVRTDAARTNGRTSREHNAA